MEGQQENTINTKSTVKIRYKVAKWIKIVFPIGGAFFLINGIYHLSNDGFFLNIGNILIGVIYIFFPLLKEKNEVVTFGTNEISYKTSFVFGKPKKLLYADIKEAAYLAGDFVFRNKEHEVRLVKEYLNKKDIAFLEEKINELNTVDAYNSL